MTLPAQADAVHMLPWMPDLLILVRSSSSSSSSSRNSSSATTLDYDAVKAYMCRQLL